MNRRRSTTEKLAAAIRPFVRPDEFECDKCGASSGLDLTYIRAGEYPKPPSSLQDVLEQWRQGSRDMVELPEMLQASCKFCGFSFAMETKDSDGSDVGVDV